MITIIRCLLLVALFVSCAQAQDPRDLDPRYAEGETQVLSFGYLDKGQGPTVVFYHPGVDARYWQWAIEGVTPSYRAIAMPFDAVAPAAPDSVISAFSLTALLQGIVTGLDVEPPHLVAHSIGGREALELAIARPDLISSLTVIEPALAPDPESQAELVAAAAASDAACPFSDAGDASCALQTFINEPGFYDNAPDFLVELLRRAPAPAVPLEALFQPIRPSICDALGEVDMPILFIRGSLTPEPIQKSLDAYEACLSDHESATIADSAHYPFVYNPEAFNEKLLQFLQAQVAAPMAASQPAGPNFGWVPPDDRGVTDLGDGLSVVSLSFPGNVAVLTGADGILLIDDQMPQLDEQLVSEIKAISGEDAGAVRFIINTHLHPDHAGSNAIWKERGATIVAHENVRVSMSTEGFNPMNNTVTPPSPEGMWPIVTFSEDMSFHLNGQTVHIVHPDPAHTNGDSIVYFIEANAVHTGDIYLNKAFPVVDAANGGSLDGIIAALEGIAARIDDETRVIPGHGPVSNKAELEAYTASIREMRTIITELVELGMTREQVVAAQPLARFEEEFDLLTGLFPADVIVAGAYQAISEGR